MKNLTIYYLGDFHRYCTESYIADAFERLGHRVIRTATDRANHSSILADCFHLRPDMFLFAKCEFQEACIPWPRAADAVARLLTAIRPHVKIICGWHWDLMAHEFSKDRFQWMQKVCQHVDLFAMTDGYTAKQLPNTTVIHDGPLTTATPETHPEIANHWPDYSRPEEFAGDVLFVGSLYGERTRWWARFKERMRRAGALVARMGPGSTPDETPVGYQPGSDVRGAALTKLVRSYKLTIQPPWPWFPEYWSDRITVLAAHGGLVAAPNVPGMKEDGWVEGANFLSLERDEETYTRGVWSYLDQIRTVPDYPEYLGNVRRAGFIHATVNCTWDKRVGQLLTGIGARKLQ